MNKLKTLGYATLATLGIATVTPNYVAAQETSKDGISFYDKNSGLEKRLFMPGEDVRAKITLPAGNEGKDVHIYGFNPHGKLVKDTIVKYDTGIDLDIDESIKGEHTLIAYIKDNPELLRYSAGVVGSKKEGRKLKFEDYSKNVLKRNKSSAFAKNVVNANEDSVISGKEIIGLHKMSMSHIAEFDENDERHVLYNRDTDLKMKFLGKAKDTEVDREKIVGNYTKVSLKKFGVGGYGFWTQNIKGMFKVISHK